MLQVRQGAEVLTLKLEKQQVAGLSQLLVELLSDLPAPEEPEPAPGLDEPVVADWAVGTLALSYDSGADRVIIVAEELAAEPSEMDPDANGARIGLTRSQCLALAELGTKLVASGRPLCSLCGYPLDPQGHSCPKTNGHRAPTL